jgi:hypothetical protein
VKKIATFTILLLYLNASAQTLLPFVVDSIAHILFWHEHLEHVHHGHEDHDHVAEEIHHLLSEDTKNDPVPTHPAVVLKSVVSEHLNQLLDFSVVKNQDLAATIFAYFISPLPVGYCVSSHQPPEQA